LESSGELDRLVEALFAWTLEHHRAQVTELELTPQLVEALRLLRNGTLLASKLALFLGISAPAVSQLTDRLYSRGLILRRPGEADRRSVLIELTAEGRGIIDAIRERRRVMFKSMIALMPQADRQKIEEALAPLARLLELRIAGAESPDPGRVEQPPGDAEPAPLWTAKGERPASNLRGEKELALRPRARNRMRIEWD
jgi:DNA-binding MarR family transcriptional regulator